MTQYREINTGQVINVTGEREAHIASQARWVLADGSQDPVAPKKGAQPTETKDTDVPAVSVGDNEDDGKPSPSASKADWETYAREQGKDEDEIEAATKAEIQSWFK